MANSTIILAFLFNWNMSQENPQFDLLIGKWTLKVIESENNSSDEIVGASDRDPMTLHFNQNGTFINIDFESQAPYYLTNETLTLGERTYDLIELTKDSMIIEERKTIISLGINRLVFLKVED